MDDMELAILSHLQDWRMVDGENIEKSLGGSMTIRVAKTDQALHELLRWPTYFLETEEEWSRHTALIAAHFDFFDTLHRALLEACSGYYNQAYVLLRNAFEHIIRGALWECLAHLEYRSCSDILRAYPANVSGRKMAIIDYIEDAIKKDPSLERNLAVFSVSILDLIDPIYKDEELKKLIPQFRPIVEQLTTWGVFDPILNPIKSLYGTVFDHLSKDAHAAPGRTQIGRRLLSGGDAFTHAVLPRELESFCKRTTNLADIGVLIQINIMGQLMKQKREILREKIPTLHELEMSFSERRAQAISSI